jgi:SAM-dependent methyltransferase
VRREVEVLIQILTAVGELPRKSPPVRVLDAGCGIALIPQILAFWGFEVTAIDSCSRAIEVASHHQPSDEELASCVPIWEPFQGLQGVCMLVDDLARSMQRLQSFAAAGGSASYIAGDWFDAQLTPGAFDAIYCRNSLRCSTKAYWRQSLRRFHDLLLPAGVLLLENVNAIGIRDEVEQLLGECAFASVAPGVSRTAPSKYVVSVWPTG